MNVASFAFSSALELLELEQALRKLSEQRERMWLAHGTALSDLAGIARVVDLAHVDGIVAVQTAVHRRIDPHSRSHDFHDDNNRNFHLVVAFCIRCRVLQTDSIDREYSAGDRAR